MPAAAAAQAAAGSGSGPNLNTGSAFASTPRADGPFYSAIQERAAGNIPDLPSSVIAGPEQGFLDWWATYYPNNLWGGINPWFGPRVGKRGTEGRRTLT